MTDLPRSDRSEAPEVRLATPDDLPAILGVLEAAFERWPPFDIDVSPLDHLLWKMSPPGPPAGHAVALVDGEIVAVSIRWVSRIRLGDQELIQNSSVDHAVHPALQGRGLGGAIARFAHEAAVEHSDLSLGTGSNHERIPSIFDRFDPPLVEHALVRRSRTFGPRAFASVFLRNGGTIGLARAGLRIARRAGRGVWRRRRPATGARIEELSSFDERVVPLWEAYLARFDFAVERSVDYLNWRYCDPRSGPTLVLAAYADDRMVGFAVFKPSGRWSKVLDFVIDPEHPQAAAITRDLLDEGCRRMREAGARGADLSLSERHPAAAVVEAAGFLPVGWSSVYTSGPQRRGLRSPLIERFYAGTLRSHLVFGDADLD